MVGRLLCRWAVGYE